MKTNILKMISIGSLIILYPILLFADGYTVYPTVPGTNIRDRSKPGYRVEQDYGGKTHVHPTWPGTSIRDYSKPGLRMEQDFGGRTNIYQTIPGTSIRDYSKPGWVLDGK
jgi:hypothetical protein